MMERIVLWALATGGAVYLLAYASIVAPIRMMVRLWLAQRDLPDPLGCPYCLSFWVGAAIAALMQATGSGLPTPGLAVTASMGVGLLFSGAWERVGQGRALEDELVLQAQLQARSRAGHSIPPRGDVLDHFEENTAKFGVLDLLDEGGERGAEADA